MVGSLDHYGIVVSDIERSLDFYTEQLGMDHFDDIHQVDPSFSRAVGIDGTDVELAFLDAGGTTIELVAYNEPAGDNANPEVGMNDVGASHLCLGVDDIETAYDDLEAEAEFISPPQDLETGVSLAFLKDPDGNVIELLEA